MQEEREVAVRTVVAVALWGIGIGFVLVQIFTPFRVGQVGLVCVGGAMVLNVRGYFSRLDGQMRDAFQLGRDFERGERRVHSIR